jgi:hypothetical protein
MGFYADDARHLSLNWWQENVAPTLTDETLAPVKLAALEDFAGYRERFKNFDSWLECAREHAKAAGFELVEE